MNKTTEKIGNWFYRLLRKSQKYTGTDNVYLVKGGFWLTLGQFFSLGATFLLSVAFANLLDPVTYGNYKYLLSLFGTLGIFSLIGVKTAASQAIARGFEGSFYTGFKMQLKWGTLGSLAASGAALYYWFQGNETLVIPLLLSAVFLPLMNAARIYSSFLSGKKLFSDQTKYNIYTQIVFAGVIIGTLLLTKNLFWLIAAYLMCHTFLSYFFYLLTKFKFRPNKNEDEKTFNYAKHLSAIEVISSIGSYLDKILLFNFVGSAQLAVYSFASLLPEQINNITQNVNTLAFPKLAPKSHEEIKATIMKKILKLLVLAILIIALYIIIAPYFFKIFFPQYLNAVFYSQILIFSLISLPTSLLGTIFEAKIMKKELYSLKLVTNLSRIALYIILIPIYGIWGVIIAGLGAQVLSSLFALFLFKRA